MRRFKAPVILLIATVFSLAHGIICFAQAPVTITFDGPPPQPRGTAYGTTLYFESGMFFTPETNTPGSQFTRNGGGISGFPENGSTYLQDGTGLIFSFTNGLSFSLVSVDLAGYSDVVPYIDIQFVGYKLDGSSVTNSFSGTEIDFQTYYFGPEFTNLTRVQVLGYIWSLDNLTFQLDPPVLSISMIDLLRYSPPDSENLAFVPTPLLSFFTISNQNYALEFSSSLSPASWNTLPGINENGDPASNMVGDGGQIQLMDTNAITAPQRFYRVRAVQ